MFKLLGVTFGAVAVAYLYTVFPDYNASTFNLDFASMGLPSVSRNVVKKVLAVETPEGAGALVRRSIGSMNLRNLSPFLMLDHFHVEQGVCFFYSVYFWAPN